MSTKNVKYNSDRVYINLFKMFISELENRNN